MENRMKWNKIHPNKKRNTLILTDAGWSLAWAIEKDLFGTWPANESRIAENDNGFVKLSEVANGE